MSNLGKYESRNPLKRALWSRFLSRARGRVPIEPDISILDVGTGEGLFWATLPERERVGVDVRPEALERAAKDYGITPILASALDMPFPDRSFDFFTAIEIFEHLDNPGAAAAEIARVTNGRGIITVPWEPWFSLMTLFGTGKHWRRLGREEEHVQAFGPKELNDLLSDHFEAVEVTTCLPWLIASIGNKDTLGRSRGGTALESVSARP